MINLPIKIKLDDSFFAEETRCDHVVSSEMKQLWAVLLDLLVEFDTVCREYHIKYVLEGGTLLGAIRHKGFIPWDDDVDVIMLREEYEKLEKVAPTAFKHPYFWQTTYTDPGSLRPHGQLRNSATTCILRYEMDGDKPKYGFNQGVFLDVFVWDEVPDDSEEYHSFCKKLEVGSVMLGVLKDMYWNSNRAQWAKSFQDEAFNEFEKFVSHYNGTGCKRVGNVSLLIHPEEKLLLPKTIFKDLTDWQFESFKFPVPKDYETMLTAYFGNWHELVKGGSMHGTLFADMFTPYTAFVDRNSHQHADTIASNYPIMAIFKHSVDELENRQRKIRRLRHKNKLIAISLSVICLFLLLALLLSLFL